MIINSLKMVKNDDTIYFNYKINVSEKLQIREKPDNQSNIVAYVKECELVKLIGLEDNANFDNTNHSSFLHVQTLGGLNGFVKREFLRNTQHTPDSEFYTNKFTYNSYPFDILGKWKAYPDVENMVNFYYIFYPKKAVVDYYFPPEEATDYKPRTDEEHDYAVGPYEYDDCCNIKVPMESGKTLHFKVVKKNGLTTIMLNCFIFDPILTESIGDIP